MSQMCQYYVNIIISWLVAVAVCTCDELLAGWLMLDCCLDLIK